MLAMNPQLHHTVAFARIADDLRRADRRRRQPLRRPRSRLLRRFA
jgi:hypothetical protein